MPGIIVISKGTELHRFPVDALVCITADGNYSHAKTVDGRDVLLSLQLGQVEDMIHVQQKGSGTRNLIRIGRGLIINTDFVHHIDISRQLLVMSDCRGLRIELTASREALIKLKELLEQPINNISHD